ncbi:MAG: hypothetical protein SNJ82_05950, partial [Gemmataceae bacterium]
MLGQVEFLLLSGTWTTRVAGTTWTADAWTSDAWNWASRARHRHTTRTRHSGHPWFVRGRRQGLWIERVEVIATVESRWAGRLTDRLLFQLLQSSDDIFQLHFDGWILRLVVLSGARGWLVGHHSARPATVL